MEPKRLSSVEADTRVAAIVERLVQALEAAAVAARPPVDALVYTPAEWDRMKRSGNTFVERIEEEARIVYDRESALARVVRPPFERSISRPLNREMARARPETAS